MEMTGLTKLTVCCLVIISSTLLGCLKVIDGAAAGVLISGTLGYVFGNTHGIMSTTKQVSEMKSSVIGEINTLSNDMKEMNNCDNKSNK
jgi:hypothetical protein